jgi:hypothetical protein
MGFLADAYDRYNQYASTQSGWVLALAGTASFLAIVVFLNVLSQLLFKKKNEPPVVFHLFPIIGSTITYGMDPYKFFSECRDKVRRKSSPAFFLASCWQRWTRC